MAARRYVRKVRASVRAQLQRQRALTVRQQARVERGRGSNLFESDRKTDTGVKFPHRQQINFQGP